MSRKRRRLTPEEQELWSRVAKTAEALHPPGKPADETDGRANTSGETAPKSSKFRSIPDFRIGSRIEPPSRATVKTEPAPSQKLSEAPLRMDHKTHKRMLRGKLKPEARIDLHGMTLAMAQPELTRFILSCRAKGMRLVLVITGKGRGDHGPLPTRHGALRHIVPHWLHQMPLYAAVQQVTAAHYRHGGQGAYYVYLRR